MIDIIRRMLRGIMMLMMPEMKRNYVGTYRGLMTTVAEIFILHPSIRIYSIRASPSILPSLLSMQAAIWWECSDSAESWEPWLPAA
jgi:hypothetical protein